MTNPKCSCGAPLICFSELAGRDELLAAAQEVLMAYGWTGSPSTNALREAIKLAESRHPVEVAK